ncbi:MAG TPA: zinc-dependent metalloprotease [Actinomycetota bacterium]|nr:zinc-dependent metalloprotease [Actinomycetota bacterium]
MSDRGGGFGFPFGIDPESLRDAPLFREMQRVMSASSGPVNWELARQVAVASAAESGDDRETTAQDLQSFEEAVRVAELHVARFTELEPPTDVAEVRAVRRAEWIGSNTDSLAALLEPAAKRIGESMDLAQREALPPEAQAMSGMLAQISPLLMGAQVGQVLGSLAQNVFGQFDVALPRSGPGAVMFVVPNIRRFESDWSLDATDFRTFVAIHEVTHRFEFSRPWARERFTELLDDFLSTLRIDLEGIQQRLAAIDTGDPEALQRMLEGDEELFAPELDDEQRLKLGRIQAFMSAAEGYGDHVMHGLGAELLPSYRRIEEAMHRYREGEAGDPVFERLLGVEMKREQYEAGRRFCETVVELTDEATLTRMWDSAEALPSLPEVAEPRLWLARTV